MTYTEAVLMVLLVLVIALYERARRHTENSTFIERQQMQSKIDTLTEHILQQAGRPIDLNKSVREKFKAAFTKDRAFGAGWKRDLPATPPKENS